MPVLMGSSSLRISDLLDYSPGLFARVLFLGWVALLISPAYTSDDASAILFESS